MENSDFQGLGGLSSSLGGRGWIAFCRPRTASLWALRVQPVAFSVMICARQIGGHGFLGDAACCFSTLIPFMLCYSRGVAVPVRAAVYVAPNGF